MIGRTEETMYVPPLDAILRNIGTNVRGVQFQHNSDYSIKPLPVSSATCIDQRRIQ